MNLIFFYPDSGLGSPPSNFPSGAILAVNPALCESKQQTQIIENIIDKYYAFIHMRQTSKLALPACPHSTSWPVACNTPAQQRPVLDHGSTHKYHEPFSCQLSQLP